MAMTGITMKSFLITTTGDVDVIQGLHVHVPKIHRPTDMLVKVSAVSMNPLDHKVRKGLTVNVYGPPPKPSDPIIMGYDCCGTVIKCGNGCKWYHPGDRVWFACDVQRPGSNAQYVVVDERIVSMAPKTLSDAQAAALPLTALTAWEAMEDCMGLTRDHKVNANKSMLILPGASGVGSIAIQLAKHVFGVGKVIGTASRHKSVLFVDKMGADDVIDARAGLVNEFDRHQLDSVDYILNCMPPDMYLTEYGKIAKPDCKICSVVDGGNLNGNVDFFLKRLSLSFENRQLRASGDGMERHHEILDELYRMVDDGTICTTMTKELVLNLDNLRSAHYDQESGQVIGKTCLVWHDE